MPIPAEETQHVIRLAKAVARRCRWMGLDRDDAVQEVLARVYTYADRYDPARSSLTTWVFLVGKHALVRRWRQKRTESRWTGARDISIDEPATSDGDRCVGDTLGMPAREYDDTSDVVRRSLSRVLAAHSYASGHGGWLRAKKQVDVLLKHRLLADEPATLEACGARCGVVREVMRQREEKLLAALRMDLAAHGVTSPW